ncbi:MAG: hypothetical protein Q7K03_01980 [Dehalococcoidia bacterium]|nr:hypothetical protein [Dehalococcoidia bacterium]
MKSFGGIAATAVLIAALVVFASCGRPVTSEDTVSSSAGGGPTLAAIVLEVPTIF